MSKSYQTGKIALARQQLERELGHQPPVAQIRTDPVAYRILPVSERQGREHVQHVQHRHANTLNTPRSQVDFGGLGNATFNEPSRHHRSAVGRGQ